MAAAAPDEKNEDSGQTDPAPKRWSEPSTTTLAIEQQVQADFDSSSPGGTDSGFGGLAVLGLLAAFIVFNIAIVIRRARGQPPPPETLHHLQ